MPVIELPKEIFGLVESILPDGTETSPTHKVRLGLALIKHSKLSKEETMTLLGYSHSDCSLTNYLKEEET